MENTIHVDTPESVDVALEPAGFGSRFVAALLDGLIQYAVVFLLLLIAIPTVSLGGLLEKGTLTGAEGVLLAILLLLGGFLFFGYKLLLEAFWNGQTVGKRVIGIRVVQSSGMPAGFLQILIRNLLRIVDFLPIFYIIGSVAVLASRRDLRLGDMVAGTVVVRDRVAPLPLLPRGLSYQPEFDLALLQERVLRLSESDLEAARGFWQRRTHLEPNARARVAATIVEGLIQKMAWAEPAGPTAEHFIEAILFVRSKPL